MTADEGLYAHCIVNGNRKYDKCELLFIPEENTAIELALPKDVYDAYDFQRVAEVQLKKFCAEFAVRTVRDAMNSTTLNMNEKNAVFLCNRVCSKLCKKLDDYNVMTVGFRKCESGLSPILYFFDKKACYVLENGEAVEFKDGKEIINVTECFTASKGMILRTLMFMAKGAFVCYSRGSVTFFGADRFPYSEDYCSAVMQYTAFDFDKSVKKVAEETGLNEMDFMSVGAIRVLGQTYPLVAVSGKNKAYYYTEDTNTCYYADLTGISVEPFNVLEAFITVRIEKLGVLLKAKNGVYTTRDSESELLLNDKESGLTLILHELTEADKE